MYKLKGAGQTARLLKLQLLRKLVEAIGQKELNGRRWIPIDDAAEMLACSPEDVGRRLRRTLNRTPDPTRIHISIDWTNRRIQMWGIFLFGAPFSDEWTAVVRRAKRRTAWKEARKLPPPPKTFTARQAAGVLKRSPEEAFRRLEELRSAYYLNAFLLAGKPVFWQRSFD